METSDKIVIGAGLGLVALAALSMGGSSSSSGGNWTGTKYARTTTYNALKADGHQTWRDPASDEYGSMCGTFAAAFGYDVCNTGWDKINSSTILSWFKAMDINPVHHQDYAGKYKADIQHFYANVRPQRYWENVGVGEGLVGVSGIYYIGCVSGLESGRCLG